MQRPISLYRLIYASAVCEGVGSSQVRAILDVSRRNNAALGVTGLLCFSSGVFLQWLEGRRDAVNRLYHRIASDPRHRDPVLLWLEDAHERVFADWSMGYVGEGVLASATLFRFGISRLDELRELSGAAVVKLLLALGDQARRLGQAA
ncbi:MAG: hypothetical protein KatS3mg125_0441 [Lysobacterales bacterium]|nr:MAG: hypothetical protein KatS3mg125_0441 [Xanthomonadales bacterium]